VTHRGAASAGLLALVIAGTLARTGAQAAPGDADALLRSLIGKNQATVEARMGPPDESESNGVQTFLRYRAFDVRRTSSTPDPFGYAQGYSGGLGLYGKASFDCVTTLVLADGALRAYARKGNDCH